MRLRRLWEAGELSNRQLDERLLEVDLEEAREPAPPAEIVGEVDDG